MKELAQADDPLPVWGRPDAFPPALPGWGWVGLKGATHPCASLDELIEAIRDDKDGIVALVWSPSNPRMVLPEELPEAADAVIASRKRRAGADLADALDRLKWFGLIMAGLAIYLFYQGWALAPAIAFPGERLAFGIKAVTSSMSMGIAVLMFLIFAFIPWYQSIKRLRELSRWTLEDIESAVPVLRFETWLDLQKSPVTRLLLGLIVIVGAGQLLPGDSVAAAGLVKTSYYLGEWWRLFTAPLLHGNLIHFLMNSAALLYLGKRLEVFAGWPHLPLVFLFASCVGGEASARWLAAPSIGASGGLMGWLGFLLVFESLHGKLVPRSARKRLLAGVLITALIGVLGYRFIDNAAHAGGLLAGMLYALIVFPKSSSVLRPRSTLVDRIAGAAALIAIAAAALYAVSRMAG